MVNIMDNFDPKKGTTTVALVGTDGVVMAADMRASMGYLIANKEAEKVNIIDDHMAMTIAGSVGDAQTLIRWMRAETSLYKMNNKKGMPIKSASTLLANILQGNKYYPFMVQLLLGGYDYQDGPSVYSLDAIGGVTTEKYTSTGSGSPVAYGYLESHYKTGLTIKELLPVAVNAIATAMKRDIATGDGINLISISKNGYIQYSKEQIQSLISK
jgi:proteasome beta subunit